MSPTTAPAQAASATRTFIESLQLPVHWPAQMDLIEWCQRMPPLVAALLLLFGIIYLMFGVNWYKWLVTINAALLGGYIGLRLGRMTDGPLVGAFIGAFTAAAVTLPLMKWCVAVMGGIYGGLLGAAIWRSFGLEPQFAWAGALSGLIFFGMLSFIIFRGSIIAYMSLQGSVMTIFGLLGLIFKSTAVAPQIAQHLQLKPFILPAAIFIPALIGLIYQQTTGATADAKKK